jgi:hypothetical protein
MKFCISLLFALILCSYTGLSQQMQRISGISVYATAGPNYFLNNFQQFKKRVDPMNYNLSFRIMWEPAYRVSLGLKTGYYKISTVSLIGPKANANFILSAIPIQLFVKTKISKRFYAFYGMGPSVCLNTMSASNGESIHASFVSFADMSAGFGYLKSLNKKVLLGAEFEFYHSSKSAENILTLAVVAGWRL